MVPINVVLKVPIKVVLELDRSERSERRNF